MMNRAVNGPQTHQPGALEQVSYLTSLERTQPAMSQMAPNAQPRMEVRIIIQGYSVIFPCNIII
jgi:hypothetical protein